MKLDNEGQRELILGAINACSFSGKMVERVYMLKLTIIGAALEQVTPKNDAPDEGK
jgi:hypothetical protein